MWFKRQDFSSGMDAGGGEVSFDPSLSGFSSQDTGGNFASSGNSGNFNNGNFNGNMSPSSQPIVNTQPITSINQPIVNTQPLTSINQPIVNTQPITSINQSTSRSANSPNLSFLNSIIPSIPTPTTPISLNTHSVENQPGSTLVPSTLEATPSVTVPSQQPAATLSDGTLATQLQDSSQSLPTSTSFRPAPKNTNNPVNKYQPETAPASSKRIYVGTAIACAFGVLVLILLLYVGYLKKNRKSSENSVYEYTNQATGSVASNDFNQTKSWLAPKKLKSISVPLNGPSDGANEMLSYYSTEFTATSGLMRENNIFEDSEATDTRCYEAKSALTIMYSYPTDSYEAATELEQSEAMFSDRSIQSITEASLERDSMYDNLF